jgi:hypothetical protein
VYSLLAKRFIGFTEDSAAYPYAYMQNYFSMFRLINNNGTYLLRNYNNRYVSAGDGTTLSLSSSNGRED